jgi:hypothetical protein
VSDTERFATSIGRSTHPDSVTFEVSDVYLLQPWITEWSQPVQFRFCQKDDGTYDLMFRKPEE